MNLDVKDPPRKMSTKCGDIKRDQKFEFLGEILTPNLYENAATEENGRKMEIAF